MLPGMMHCIISSVPYVAMGIQAILFPAVSALGIDGNLFLSSLIFGVILQVLSLD
jgi:hypothetical protein